MHTCTHYAHNPHSSSATRVHAIHVPSRAGTGSREGRREGKKVEEGGVMGGGQGSGSVVVSGGIGGRTILQQ